MNATRTGELFGIAEVDIRVPDKWNDGDGAFTSEMPSFQHFKEFSPVFCTTDVPRVLSEITCWNMLLKIIFP